MREHPPPGTPCVMKQTWSDLLFMHWRVDEAMLRELIPAPLEVDTFDGTGWIAVVPFLMTGIRLNYLPPIPGTSRTLELNVRTYVRYGQRKGVYFFSLDAENGFIVNTARRWFGLPYYKAQMSLRKATYTRYESKRVHPGAPPAEFRALYRPMYEPKPSLPDSLEFFLTERYCLFTADEGKAVKIGEIDHRPWPLRRAEAEIETNTMLQPLGLKVNNGTPLLHYSSSMDVRLWSMSGAP